jgi:hypothetical protein
MIQENVSYMLGFKLFPTVEFPILYEVFWSVRPGFHTMNITNSLDTSVLDEVPA